MSMPESFEALRRANPRAREGFAKSVEAAAGAVRNEIAAADDSAPRRVRPRRRVVGLSAAGAALAAAVAVVAFGTVGSSGVESAAAAFKKATTLTAASAERSGTAEVRMTLDGELWAARTIRWHEGDVAISGESTWRVRKPGGEMRVVDGIMYGIDVDGRWVKMGSPKNIDPDSGTTPDEYLAAVHEDVGGATLRRITNGMTGLETRTLADGSTVYSGAAAAGAIARETGVKGGELLRVLPFGYVAHDQAANPSNLLQTEVTVGPEGVVREIAVTWGRWTYTVTYSQLGETAAPKAPANARDLLKGRRIPAEPARR
jgi:hypothetical protein